jgi:hypothetical protein
MKANANMHERSDCANREVIFTMKMAGACCALLHGFSHTPKTFSEIDKAKI